MKYSKFPQILKMLREDKKITQEELANHLNVSRSTIAGYEARNKQPDYDKLAQIADYFNVTIDFLITGENPTDSKLFSSIEYLTNRQMEFKIFEIYKELSYSAKHKLLEYGHLLKFYEKNDCKKSH